MFYLASMNIGETILVRKITTLMESDDIIIIF